MNYKEFYENVIEEYKELITDNAINNLWDRYNGKDTECIEVLPYIDDITLICDKMYNLYLLCDVMQIEYNEKFNKMIVCDSKNNKIEIIDFNNIFDMFEPNINDKIIITDVRSGINNYSGNLTLYTSNDTMILDEDEIEVIL